MLKLFRYLKKAYVPVIAIVLFLVVQASCDLTLPTFTSNIVNVGIQQKGIEDAVYTLSLHDALQMEERRVGKECIFDCPCLRIV